MPELPEVELIARYLRPQLVGRRILHVAATKASYFFLTPPRALRLRLPGEAIDGVDRVGKYLLVRLSSGARLLLHLGMTGQLILEANATPRFGPDVHTHLSVEFADAGSTLYFRDTRKFGKVRLLAPGRSDTRLDKLGPDALRLTSDILFGASRKRRVKTKSFLLDQTVVAGIGNIYADESLYLAGIHPERPAHSLSQADCTKLALKVRNVLRRSIRAGGSSIDDYIHPDGSVGRFQAQHRVYGRAGQPCQNCKTPIERIVIGQRSTHFCPRCQT